MTSYLGKPLPTQRIEYEYGVYEGEVKDGKKHGKGKMTWADGDVYKGGYKDNKPHGRGRYTPSKGRSKRMKYRDGVLQ